MTKRQANIYKAIKEGCRDAETFFLNSTANEFKRELRQQLYLFKKSELTTISQISYLFHLDEKLWELDDITGEEYDELHSLNFSDIES
jgi:hypothetical protein